MSKRSSGGRRGGSTASFPDAAAEQMGIPRTAKGLRAGRLIVFPAAVLLTAAFLCLPDPQLRRVRQGWEGVVIADRAGQLLYSVPSAEGGYQHRLSWFGIPEPVREIFVRLEGEKQHLSLTD